ncbi:hypothetical protein PG985_004815, partial [Apiospora marii]|uniref:uncharacterized protein n=1 Tax=Apiospora marii TaxID=335849 RepID=UPI0031323160
MSMLSSNQNAARKRRRSESPNWTEFYKNGVPKVVIVIDDTPEPDGDVKDAASNCSATTFTGTGVGSDAGIIPRHVAKKRRKDDEYVKGGRVVNGSHIATPNSVTSSTDRTTSAQNTTAPTSLASLSFNGQYEYEQASAPGLKRKRTRQQHAQEAKRRDIEALGDAYISYRPPPTPIKIWAKIAVPVVTDRYSNNKVDDEDGHYIVVPDTDITQRYQINKLLGEGTFGRVLQARDKERNELVAIKINRSVQEFRDASRTELRVLQTLKANDEENRNQCIHLRDCFDFRGHICIVMDLLGSSIFDFLKSNDSKPFPNSQIQSFARQLLTSVAFLHDLNIIHTDLKPENILLCDDTHQTCTYHPSIPSSSSGAPNQASQRKVLLNTEIRLIDFGSATFEDEHHHPVVSTRPYRAPEIILGLGWSFPCDIWSVGCILVELFTGDALFQTHDNLEHLAMMEKVCDRRIDQHLTQQVTKDIVPKRNSFLRSFLDLLEKIFICDPARRITARQALNHPWLKEVAIAEDGTEAAGTNSD